ncbi:hypothetical protein [Streptomyces sp. NPDC050121]|uniref:effector-associated constant component EACC1 n=1 Tax=Streptomyces sp. NPDC050121 TaxID=3365601 RepID=UPI0037AC20F5
MQIANRLTGRPVQTIAGPARDRRDPGASAGAGTQIDGSDTAGWAESFADWITEDRRLSRSATMRRVRLSPGDGGMSPDLVSRLDFAVSSGSFLTELIARFGDFRVPLPRQERTPARLVVERNGIRVIIEEGTPQDTARVSLPYAASAVIEPRVRNA